MARNVITVNIAITPQQRDYLDAQVDVTQSRSSLIRELIWQKMDKDIKDKQNDSK